MLKEEMYRDKMEIISNKNEYEHRLLEIDDELYNWINKKVARDCTLTSEERTQIEQKVYDGIDTFLNINESEVL